MIADGERLKTLMSGACHQVLLCAPFIKVAVLRTLLSSIQDDVPVRIVTRWRAREVAAGVSDLEVFDVASERPFTVVTLLDDLHAKLFLADENGLAGSANLTAAALGWAQTSNLELLLEVKRSDNEVDKLLRRLEHAKLANETIRSAVEAEAAMLNVEPVDEVEELSNELDAIQSHAWFPSCAAPGRLWSIYNDVDPAAVVESTREDGFNDLRDLHIPSGLSPSEFEQIVRDTLVLMPTFRRIIDRIPQGVNDSAGTAMVLEVRPDFEQPIASLQWRIIRDWISEFFRDEFEVAPESFVTRIRQR